MTSTPELAYVAHSLPAASWPERAALARQHGLALEVAHGRGDDVERALDLGLRVATIQAYGLHDAHALSPRDEDVRAGQRHLEVTIELARRARVPRVLAVCGFGHAPVADPFGRALRFFREATEHAREAGVTIVLELLGRARAAALVDPDELARLVGALDAADALTTAIDTGHLLDGGADPAEVLARWTPPLAELQLRGPDGTPPAPELPLENWIARARGAAVIAIEHRAPIEHPAFEALLARVRRALAP